jgi:V-type H+-transporting ATPase subunit H
MIKLGMQKTFMNLSIRNFDDSDVKELLDKMKESMSESIEELSSFNEYRQEIFSTDLEWGPVHTSEKFWKENINKFTDEDYRILRSLVDLLDSKVPKTLAIACNDLGKFVQYHPQGRSLVIELNAKDKIFNLMESKEEDLKSYALLTTQKIMIQNWEFLDR